MCSNVRMTPKEILLSAAEWLEKNHYARCEAGLMKDGSKWRRHSGTKSVPHACNAFGAMCVVSGDPSNDMAVAGARSILGDHLRLPFNQKPYGTGVPIIGWWEDKYKPTKEEVIKAMREVADEA